MEAAVPPHHAVVAHPPQRRLGRPVLALQPPQVGNTAEGKHPAISKVSSTSSSRSIFRRSATRGPSGEGVGIDGQQPSVAQRRVGRSLGERAPAKMAESTPGTLRVVSAFFAQLDALESPPADEQSSRKGREYSPSFLAATSSSAASPVAPQHPQQAADTMGAITGTAPAASLIMRGAAAAAAPTVVPGDSPATVALLGSLGTPIPEEHSPNRLASAPVTPPSLASSALAAAAYYFPYGAHGTSPIPTGQARGAGVETLAPRSHHSNPQPLPLVSTPRSQQSWNVKQRGDMLEHSSAAESSENSAPAASYQRPGVTVNGGTTGALILATMPGLPAAAAAVALGSGNSEAPQHALLLTPSSSASAVAADAGAHVTPPASRPGTPSSSMLFSPGAAALLTPQTRSAIREVHEGAVIMIGDAARRELQEGLGLIPSASSRPLKTQGYSAPPPPAAAAHDAAADSAAMLAAAAASEGPGFMSSAAAMAASSATSRLQAAAQAQQQPASSPADSDGNGFVAGSEGQQATLATAAAQSQLLFSPPRGLLATGSSSGALPPLVYTSSKPPRRPASSAAAAISSEGDRAVSSEGDRVSSEGDRADAEMGAGDLHLSEGAGREWGWGPPQPGAPSQTLAAAAASHATAAPDAPAPLATTPEGGRTYGAPGGSGGLPLSPDLASFVTPFHSGGGGHEGGEGYSPPLARNPAPPPPAGIAIAATATTTSAAAVPLGPTAAPLARPFLTGMARLAPAGGSRGMFAFSPGIVRRDGLLPRYGMQQREGPGTVIQEEEMVMQQEMAMQQEMGMQQGMAMQQEEQPAAADAAASAPQSALSHEQQQPPQQQQYSTARSPMQRNGASSAPTAAAPSLPGVAAPAAAAAVETPVGDPATGEDPTLWEWKVAARAWPPANSRGGDLGGALAPVSPPLPLGAVFPQQQRGDGAAPAPGSPWLDETGYAATGGVPPGSGASLSPSAPLLQRVSGVSSLSGGRGSLRGAGKEGGAASPEASPPTAPQHRNLHSNANSQGGSGAPFSSVSPDSPVLHRSGQQHQQPQYPAHPNGPWTPFASHPAAPSSAGHEEDSGQFVSGPAARAVLAAASAEWEEERRFEVLPHDMRRAEAGLAAAQHPLQQRQWDYGAAAMGEGPPPAGFTPFFAPRSAPIAPLDTAPYGSGGRRLGDEFPPAALPSPGTTGQHVPVAGAEGGWQAAAVAAGWAPQPLPPHPSYSQQQHLLQSEDSTRRHTGTSSGPSPLGDNSSGAPRHPAAAPVALQEGCCVLQVQAGCKPCFDIPVPLAASLAQGSGSPTDLALVAPLPQLPVLRAASGTPAAVVNNSGSAVPPGSGPLPQRLSVPVRHAGSGSPVRIRLAFGALQARLVPAPQAGASIPFGTVPLGAVDAALLAFNSSPPSLVLTPGDVASISMAFDARVAMESSPLLRRAVAMVAASTPPQQLQGVCVHVELRVVLTLTSVPLDAPSSGAFLDAASDSAATSAAAVFTLPINARFAVEVAAAPWSPPSYGAVAPVPHFSQHRERGRSLGPSASAAAALVPAPHSNTPVERRPPHRAASAHAAMPTSSGSAGPMHMHAPQPLALARMPPVVAPTASRGSGVSPLNAPPTLLLHPGSSHADAAAAYGWHRPPHPPVPAFGSSHAPPTSRAPGGIALGSRLPASGRRVIMLSFANMHPSPASDPAAVGAPAWVEEGTEGPGALVPFREPWSLGGEAGRFMHSLALRNRRGPAPTTAAPAAAAARDEALHPGSPPQQPGSPFTSAVTGTTLYGARRVVRGSGGLAHASPREGGRVGDEEAHAAAGTPPPLHRHGGPQKPEPQGAERPGTGGGWGSHPVSAEDEEGRGTDDDSFFGDHHRMLNASSASLLLLAQPHPHSRSAPAPAAVAAAGDDYAPSRVSDAFAGSIADAVRRLRQQADGLAARMERAEELGAGAGVRPSFHRLPTGGASSMPTPLKTAKKRAGGRTHSGLSQQLQGGVATSPQTEVHQQQLQMQHAPVQPPVAQQQPTGGFAPQHLQRQQGEPFGSLALFSRKDAMRRWRYALEEAAAGAARAEEEEGGDSAPFDEEEEEGGEGGGGHSSGDGRSQIATAGGAAPHQQQLQQRRASASHHFSFSLAVEHGGSVGSTRCSSISGGEGPGSAAVTRDELDRSCPLEALPLLPGAFVTFNLEDDDEVKDDDELGGRGGGGRTHATAQQSRSQSVRSSASAVASGRRRRAWPLGTGTPGTAASNGASFSVSSDGDSEPGGSISSDEEEERRVPEPGGRRLAPEAALSSAAAPAAFPSPPPAPQEGGMGSWSSGASDVAPIASPLVQVLQPSPLVPALRLGGPEAPGPVASPPSLAVGSPSPAAAVGSLPSRAAALRSKLTTLLAYSSSAGGVGKEGDNYDGALPALPTSAHAQSSTGVGFAPAPSSSVAPRREGSRAHMPQQHVSPAPLSLPQQLPGDAEAPGGNRARPSDDAVAAPASSSAAPAPPQAQPSLPFQLRDGRHSVPATAAPGAGPSSANRPAAPELPLPAPVHASLAPAASARGMLLQRAAGAAPSAPVMMQGVEGGALLPLGPVLEGTETPKPTRALLHSPPSAAAVSLLQQPFLQGPIPSPPVPVLSCPAGALSPLPSPASPIAAKQQPHSTGAPLGDAAAAVGAAPPLRLATTTSAAAAAASAWFVHPSTTTITIPHPAPSTSADAPGHASPHSEGGAANEANVEEEQGRRLRQLQRAVEADTGGLVIVNRSAASPLLIVALDAAGRELGGAGFPEGSDVNAWAPLVRLSPFPLPVGPCSEAEARLLLSLPPPSSDAASQPQGAAVVRRFDVSGWTWNPYRRTLSCLVFLQQQGGDNDAASSSSPAAASAGSIRGDACHVRVCVHESRWEAAGWAYNSASKSLLSAPAPAASPTGTEVEEMELAPTGTEVEEMELASVAPPTSSPHRRPQGPAPMRSPNTNGAAPLRSPASHAHSSPALPQGSVPAFVATTMAKRLGSAAAAGSSPPPRPLALPTPSSQGTGAPSFSSPVPAPRPGEWVPGGSPSVSELLSPFDPLGVSMHGIEFFGGEGGGSPAVPGSSSSRKLGPAAAASAAARRSRTLPLRVRVSTSAAPGAGPQATAGPASLQANLQLAGLLTGGGSHQRQHEQQHPRVVTERVMALRAPELLGDRDPEDSPAPSAGLGLRSPQPSGSTPASSLAVRTAAPQQQLLPSRLGPPHAHSAAPSHALRSLRATHWESPLGALEADAAASASPAPSIGFSVDSAPRAVPGMYFSMRTVYFPPTQRGGATRVRIQLCNTAPVAVTARVSLSSSASLQQQSTAGGPSSGISSGLAFHVKRAHRTIELRPLTFCMLPVTFRPPPAPASASRLSLQASATMHAVLTVQAEPASAGAGDHGGSSRDQQLTWPLKTTCRALLVGEAAAGVAGN